MINRMSAHSVEIKVIPLEDAGGFYFSDFMGRTTSWDWLGTAWAVSRSELEYFGRIFIWAPLLRFAQGRRLWHLLRTIWKEINVFASQFPFQKHMAVSQSVCDLIWIKFDCWFDWNFKKAKIFFFSIWEPTTPWYSDNWALFCQCRCFFSRKILTFSLILTPISTPTLTLSFIYIPYS